MPIDVKMPDLSATEGSDILVKRWLVTEGARVKRGQPLLEVETDKATTEVEFGSDRNRHRNPRSPRREGRDWRSHRADRGRRMNSPFDNGWKLDLLDRMIRIREFEEGVRFLFLEGAMPGTIHQCQGQEATAVGVCAALRRDDFITSTFRGHGHAIAKGLGEQELLDELFGASTGCCKGKGGSMHVGDMSKGMVPGIAIVGGGIPLAAGMALAFKMQKSDRIVACFFGDGAVAEGAFHEGVNMAAIWRLPAIFVCENNLYGASTRIDLVMRNARVADRAAQYGIAGETVDGNDVEAVYAATERAAARCRAGDGPVLLELLTYRQTGHSRRDPRLYQPEAEKKEWAARDPIEVLSTRLQTEGIADEAEIEEMRSRAAKRFAEAVKRARAAPQPSIDDLKTDLFAEAAP